MAAATEISIYDAVTVDPHFHIKRRTRKAFLDIFAFLPVDLGNVAPHTKEHQEALICYQPKKIWVVHFDWFVQSASTLL